MGIVWLVIYIIVGMWFKSIIFPDGIANTDDKIIKFLVNGLFLFVWGPVFIVILIVFIILLVYYGLFE